jgi:hypothetical protein
MEDWNDILPTKNGKAPERIQWTPSPTGQVRVSLSSNGPWTEPEPCKKAADALHIGARLINESKKGRR